MLTIRTNVAATQAKKDYHASSREMTKSFERLSSGFRITKAADDTAGLSVGTNLTAQIQSLKQSTRNAMDGLSALQTVEGSLAAGQELLSRLRQLTMQIVSDGVGQDGREMIKREVDAVLEEMRRISETTEFNGFKLLDGSVSSLDFQIGIRGGTEDFLSLAARDVGLSSLGLHGFLDLYKQQSNNPGSGPERASHALTYGVSTIGYDLNQVRTFTDSTLENGFGAQTMTFTAADGSTQVHTTSANDTAREIANSLSSLQGVRATAENAVKINNFSQFSGTTYLRFHDGVNSNAAININGQNLSEINTSINGNSTLQSRGISSRIVSGELLIYAQNGDDIQLDANSASGGSARMTGVYSGSSAMVYNYNSSSTNSGTVGGVLRMGIDAGYAVDVDSSSNIFNEGNVENHSNWSNGSAKSATSMGDADLNKNSVGAQTVTVSGQYGSANVSVTEGESAKSIASKIDGQYLQTGVNATARTDVKMSGLSHDGTVSFTLAGDGGTTVSISAAVTTGDLSNLVSDINTHTGTTGITASLDASNSSILRMAHSSGEDIRITNFDHSTSAVHLESSLADLRTINVGPGNDNLPASAGVTLSDGGNALQDQMNGTVIGGEITFSSGKDFDLSSSIDGGTPASFAEEAPGSLFGTDAGTAVSGSVEIQSNESLNLVDNALTIISDLRAQYGAAQNRLMSVMTTIDTSMDSLNAGRARVMDADVASEVANVSSNQVLQQAGAAILNSSYDFTGHALRLLDK